MVELRLNLLRGRVPPLRQRRARYVGMLAYLAGTGALLAATLAFSTARYVRASLLRDELNQLETSFAETHPDSGGIVEYADRAEALLQRRVAVLRDVEHELSGCPRPAVLTFLVADSLPPGVTLRSLDLDAGAGSATFELHVSGRQADGGGAGAPELVARWNQDDRVRAHVADVAYLGSQREAGAENESMLWRFSARLARGGP